MTKTIRAVCAFLLALWMVSVMLFAPGTALAADKPPGIAAAGDAWRAALPRDPAAATDAYLARLSPEARAQSNAYFEGGYWLELWNLLVGLAVAWLLLASRASAWLRDRVERLTRFKFLQAGLFASGWLLASWLLSLPLTIYEGFTREHAYGMATQTFVPWLGEQLLQLAISLVAGGIVIALLYVVLRRAPKRWWIGASVLGVVATVVLLLLGPIFIEPLFNTYKPLEDGPVKARLLSMAHANGVPATDILEFDASRQTTRVSANVSGIFGSASIRLNDNLLRRSSPAEIAAVTAHEMGHYVLNHIEKMTVQFAVILVIGMAWLQWAFDRLQRRFGAAWRVHGVGDPAGLPLLAALLSVYLFVLTPITNTMIRVQEAEADNYSLNAAREPDGLAEVMLKLAEYRKTSPGAWEEWIFFDHPSARNRIFAAMRWKAEQPRP